MNRHSEIATSVPFDMCLYCVCLGNLIWQIGLHGNAARQLQEPTYMPASSTFLLSPHVAITNFKTGVTHLLSVHVAATKYYYHIFHLQSAEHQ